MTKIFPGVYKNGKYAIIPLKGADGLKEKRDKSSADDQVRGKAEKLLKKLGFPRSSRGFSDCVEAVVTACETDEVYGSLTKIIFPEVAKKRGKSGAAVEKAVRDTVKKGWERGNREKFRLIFGDDYRPLKGSPTAGEFIEAARDYLEEAG